jgi:hypothetical protein
MAALYATVIKKNIYEEYDEEYGVKPIFILESDIFGPIRHNMCEIFRANRQMGFEWVLVISEFVLTLVK